MSFSGHQSAIITAMKNRLKPLWNQASFDHLILLLMSVSLVIALASAGRVREFSIVIFGFLVFVLFFIRLPIFWFMSWRMGVVDCHRRQETMNMMTQLAHDMNAKLRPTKSLEIAPRFRGASSNPWPFLSGCRVNLGGTVRVGCLILCSLDNAALRGVFAHELAHLKKGHSIKILLCLVVFAITALLVGLLVTKPIIPILLIFTAGILVFSLISWHFEYEADGIGADFVQKKNMVNALEQAAKVIGRPGNSLTHPSFEKRISRLLSDKK